MPDRVCASDGNDSLDKSPVSPSEQTRLQNGVEREQKDEACGEICPKIVIGEWEGLHVLIC